MARRERENKCFETWKGVLVCVCERERERETGAGMDE